MFMEVHLYANMDAWKAILIYAFIYACGPSGSDDFTAASSLPFSLNRS